MASTFHDSNHTSTLLAVESDGKTLVNVQAVGNSLSVSDGTTGTDNGPSESLHDHNHISILMATSSTDGETPVAVYADSSGALLVDES